VAFPLLGQESRETPWLFATFGFRETSGLFVCAWGSRGLTSRFLHLEYLAPRHRRSVQKTRGPS